ncbi:MAG: efflux RND transporter permease subunit [Verrucomicrobia bacterium]|nr:MAG: efflux RND transporter permease subunit [Verrucomicrobiota bacterium]
MKPAKTGPGGPAGGGLGIADLCIRKPVFATMINLLLVVMGWFAFRELGVDQLPNVELPIVTVTTTLRGASPEEVETGVTKPLEEIINTVPGVEELGSSSREGVSSINIQFVLEKNRDVAAQDVRDKVNTVLSRLPPGAEPPIIDKFDVDASPVLTIAVSAPRDLKEITFLADKLLKQNLETVPDVGAVNLVGTRTRAVEVIVDDALLRARQLTVADVRAALQSQNLEIPGGRVDQGGRELTLRTLGRMGSVDEFRRIIVASPGGQPVHLADVARVVDGIEEPRTLSRINGTNAVSLVVRKQSGCNTVRLIEAVKRRLAELRPVLPADFQLTVIRDQSVFIERNLHEVSFHLVLGMVLVAITVFAFLHDWRGTLIAGIAIPASVVSTFTLMRAMGYTLNNSTMLGLTFSVGVVIDDAIVVLENIHRTMEERGCGPVEAAMLGTKEIALAVLATTLSLVVIFLPLAFMKGRTGQFFASYGLTVAFSILVSLFISFTLTPMLAARFLRHTDDPALREKKARGGWLMKALASGYDRILAWSLCHRIPVLLACVACVLSLAWLVPHTKLTFMPLDDTSEFEIGLSLPEGTSLLAAAAVTAEIERDLAGLRIGKDRVVTDTLVTIGPTSGRVGKGEGDVTQASIYCRLPPLGGRYAQWRGQSRAWGQLDAMGRARQVLARYPDVRSSVQAISVLGGGSGRNSELTFHLLGPDLARLTEYSDRLVETLRGDPGLADVDTTLSNRKPELQVRIDREKASQFGLHVAEIASTLRTLVGGEIVGSYKENDDQYDVWLRSRRSGRSTPEALREVMVRSVPANATDPAPLVQLSNFVRFDEARGPNQIDRFQRQRRVTVGANLAAYSLGEAVEAVSLEVARLELPPDYRVVFIGRAKQLQETIANFLLAFAISMVFMYMVLAAQFEHFVHPVSILLAVPLALPFALGWMIFLGEPLNIYAIFGLFMLVGIVKKNGILQVDYTNTLRARGMERDAAILEANRARLRPILMTTMLLVVSMIPIALGTGPGSGGRASMAKVIIGGQMLCLLLTLLVTPVSYSVFDDWGRGVFWRRAPRNDPA